MDLNPPAIDRQAALASAAEAFASWGRPGPVDGRAIAGGWRCWLAQPVPIGFSHALVRTTDGVVHRCPVGLGDQSAAAILATS